MKECRGKIGLITNGLDFMGDLSPGLAWRDDESAAEGEFGGTGASYWVEDIRGSLLYTIIYLLLRLLGRTREIYFLRRCC